MIELDLTLAWAAIIALGVFMYVLMDGFDLGVGILFPYAPSDEDRDLMMNSVAPVWDGNETWLVLGGTALFAAFPLAYAVLLPALYIPILIMLIALIFRGVAFEFRFKAGEKGRPHWDRAFHYGSLMATVAQGIVLGTFVQGVAVTGRDFAGGPFDWLTPFSLMTGAGLVSGYALLGCTWLILKTEGALQEWAYGLAKPHLIGVLTFIAIVSLWTPLQDGRIAERWFSWPNIAFLWPVPILTVAVARLLFRAVEERRERLPFLCTIALFALSYGGLAISLWPNVVPPDISIWEAASSRDSQLFLFVGVAALLPLLLVYTLYSYYVFRGKVRREAGYH